MTRPQAPNVRVVVPYTARHPLTAAGAPPGTEWAYVGEDDEAYWRVLARLWEEPEDLVILEHDVVCEPGVLPAFEVCPEPWCLHGYSDICHDRCMEAWANALGCTRFKAGLIAAVPDALSSVPRGQRGWPNLCDRLGERTRSAGFTHHWHAPRLQHHHMRLGSLSALIGD